MASSGTLGVSMSERRRRPRASCSIAASLVTGEPPSSRRAEVVDVSETGMFLRTSKDVQEGDEIRVVFDAGRCHELAGVGHVARLQAPDGVGVEFDEVDEDLRGFVRRLLDACRDAQDHSGARH